MEGVIKILYENFLMRDFLSRIIPGFLVVVALRKNNHDLTQLTWMADQDIPNWLLGLLVLGTSYFVGLSLQNLAEFLGAFSIYPSPVFFLFIHVKKLPWGWCKKAQIVAQHSAKRFAILRALFLSHLKYREKIARFEISALREAGLMSEKEEDEMRNAISK